MGTKAMAAAMVAAMALGIGCGSSVETNPGGGGHGVGGGQIAGGSVGGSGGCDGFADEQGPSTVTVTFRNNSGLPVYLPRMCDVVSYSMAAGTANDPLTYVYDSSCLQTCEDLQTQPGYDCGACMPTTIRIENGGTYQTTWDGTALKAAAMPASCWLDPQYAGSSCSQIVAAPAGSYNVQALGHMECQGACTCDATGLCEGTAAGSAAYSNTTTLSYPAQNAIEILFDNCAFGCPG